MTIIINDVTVGNSKQDILIRDSVISEIGEAREVDFEGQATRIDGDGFLAVPGLFNGHTHAAMTLLRGYGEDMPLQQWLEEKIWPTEEKLTEEDVYWGTRLACLEMIRSGTVFFNDMYWEFDGIVDAVADSGIRAMVSGVFIDQFDEEMAEQQRRANKTLYERVAELPDRVQFALGPHSIYTVSRDSLEWIAEFSREHDLPVHIHLSETKKEVEDCKQQHGVSPVKYLDEIGLLHENLIAAHCVWLDDEDIQLLARHDVSVIYNPLSNLKLTAGDDFRYDDLTDAGVSIGLGTDGAASNNNLNLWEEVKMASLIQKNRQQDATVTPARETLNLATEQPASIFNLDSGTIEEGNLADLVLIDTNHPTMCPGINRDSHLAYAVSPDAIEYVICDGDVLMEQQQISEERNIIYNATSCAKRLCESS
ncbi:MAG: amidohydrolase [bacterium]